MHSVIPHVSFFWPLGICWCLHPGIASLFGGFQSDGPKLPRSHPQSQKRRIAHQVRRSHILGATFHRISPDAIAALSEATPEKYQSGMRRIQYTFLNLLRNVTKILVEDLLADKRIASCVPVQSHWIHHSH